MTKVKNVAHLLHKKSAVSGKTPTAAQLEYGEIAVNYNADTPFVSFKNSEDSIVKIVPADNVTALTVDNANQQILLDKVNADGTVEQLSGDATNIIFEDDAKDGLRIDNHLLKVKIDETSDSGLTVSSGGVKMNADAVIDSASTNAIENKEVYRNFDEIHIVSGETTSSTTYTLNVMGVDKDVKVEVANDQYVSAITVDNANQQIILDKVNANGTVEQLSGNAENIVFESDVKDGLEVDNHLVKVKLKTGEKVLTVDTGGVESHISLSAETSVANGAATLSTILSGNTQQLNNIEHKISSGNGIAVSGGTTGVTVSAKIDATSASGLTVSANGIKLSGDTAINSASTNVVQNKVVYEQLDGLKFKHLTQAQYDALATKDSMTVYVIYEPNP